MILNSREMYSSYTCHTYAGDGCADEMVVPLGALTDLCNYLCQQENQKLRMKFTNLQ